MLNDAILKRIMGIDTQEDFDELLNILELSEAPLETREEAKRELKAQKPQFCKVDKLPSKELHAEMKDGESDISDMNGFGG